jgi:aminoglycoside phosphotransferase (APT) family kinase protein
MLARCGLGDRKMLDSKKLEYYLRLQANYGNYSLVPKGASDIRVQDIKKLSGGMANNVYSFSLQFKNKGSTQVFDLVLKGYSTNVTLWFRTYHKGEELRPYVREFETQKALSSLGFPVPEVYLYESDSFFLGYPFLIMKQEKILKERVIDISSFATSLATLHNLKAYDMGIKSLRFPEDSSTFAKDRLFCLKHYMDESRHYRFLKKDFDYALNWLELNIENNYCPAYSLIHGEYHLDHTLITDEKILKVIDWENARIGDPAFDVGYAYHYVKLVRGNGNLKLGEEAAADFLFEYTKHFHGDIDQRLEFYKLVGLLGVAIVVSSWVSSPADVYKRFGNKAFARALTFPFLTSTFLSKRWLEDDFLILYLKYCHEYIHSTLKL